MGQNTFERKFDARKTSNLDWMIGRLREIEVGAPKVSTIARACQQRIRSIITFMSLRSDARLPRLVFPLALCGWLLLPAIVLADPLLLDIRPASASATDRDPAEAIRERIETPGSLLVCGQALDRGMLASVYRQRNFAPLWSGHPEWQASLATEMESSAQEGMSPESLGLAAVRCSLTDTRLGAADRELLLTDRFLAYGAALAHGRIAFDTIEADWDLPAPIFNPVAAVTSLINNGGPATALQALKPASPGYAGLRAALARYWGFVAAGGWKMLPATTRIDMDDRGQPVVDLRRRLAAEGYLPADQSEGETFDILLAAAVVNFQNRHGLSADGRVGPMTIAALNVSAAERAAQIRRNLERWRAMPRYWPETRVEVAVPAETLTFYRNGRVALSSRVIVGDPGHPTPVLAAFIERVVLDPPWNVPASIVANEIQPKLRRDPGYLAHNHMVILGRENGDPYGRDLDWQHTSILAMGWRIRQLPGAWNALGSVVLDMPNPCDVYLHDTPARALFALPARALSHGCIRVEEVRSLAASLIAAPSLPAPGGETRSLPLPAPVPIYLLYQTVFVDEDGAVEFRDDLYGRDTRLATALASIDHAGVAPNEVAADGGKRCSTIAESLAGLAP
jgi:murein L,D-transpeptidase YcbB/YkuD